MDKTICCNNLFHLFLVCCHHFSLFIKQFYPLILSQQLHCVTAVQGSKALQCKMHVKTGFLPSQTLALCQSRRALRNDINLIRAPSVIRFILRQPGKQPFLFDTRSSVYNDAHDISVGFSNISCF